MIDIRDESKRIRLLGGAVLLVAAVIRFYRLGMEGLWLDEAYTAWLSRKPLTELLTVLSRTDEAPPFYYIVQHFMIAAGGESEFMLRLLSTLTGLGSIALLIHLAGKGNKSSCLWSALFFAVTTYSVFYARQTRSYGLVIILCFMIIHCARNLLMGRSRSAGPWLAVWGSLLVMTHNIGGIFLACGLPLGLLNWRRRYRGATLPAWLLWNGIPLLVWAVWLGISYSQLECHQSNNQWMGEFWKNHSLLAGPLIAIGTFIPGLHKPSLDAVNFPTLSAGYDIWFFISLLASAAILYGLWRVVKQVVPATTGAPAADHGAWRSVVLDGVYCLFPLLGLTAISLVWTPLFVVGRTDVIALPAFALLIGRGLSRLPRLASAGIIVFWLILTVVTLAPSYGFGRDNTTKGGDRLAAQALINAGLEPGDWVIHSFLTQPSLNYYLRRFGAAHHETWFPAEAGRNPAVLTAMDVTDTDLNLDKYISEAIALREQIARTLPADGAIWIPAVIDERYAGPREEWNRRGARINANQLSYPTSLLLYAFTGVATAESIYPYRQDWVGGFRVMLKVPRASWTALDELPPIRAEGDQ